MTRLYAVKYMPSDGPHSVQFVDDSDSTAAKQQVLAWLHSIDMTAVTIDELTVQDLGVVDEVFDLTERMELIKR